MADEGETDVEDTLDIPDTPDVSENDIDEDFDVNDADDSLQDISDTQVHKSNEDTDIEDIQIEDETDKEVEPYDESNKIPYDIVLDVLKIATQHICKNKTQLKPPVPVAIFVRYDNFVEPNGYTYDSQVAVIDYVDIVYMVYEYFLSNRTHVYAVVQCDRLTKDNIHYEWKNPKYVGCFKTKQQAKNYIKGYTTFDKK